MKKILALLLLAAASLPATELSPAERAYLIDQLELSKKTFLSAINGLSPLQWTFKPAPNSWSVAECAEHLVLAEDFLMNTVQGLLKTPAVERGPNSTAENDRKLVNLIGDRSKKATAPEPIVPAGKLATPAEAVRAFMLKRDKSIAYVRETQDDLRLHVAPGPIGPTDGYQFLLLMASHTGRHTQQIREVQGNSSYPGSR